MKGALVVVFSTLVVAAVVVTATVRMYKTTVPAPYVPRGVIPQPADSADDAAIQIFTYIYSRSHTYEYGGVILKWDNGKYMGSVPDTQDNGIGVDFVDEALAFQGVRVVADYHTHPCIEDAYAWAFSSQDIKNMTETNRPGYVADLCTGKIHYWSPGDVIDKPLFGANARLATGKIIGRIKVDGKVLR